MSENIVQNKYTNRQLIFLALDIVWKIKNLKESSLGSFDDKINKLVSLADQFDNIFDKGIVPSIRKGA